MKFFKMLGIDVLCKLGVGFVEDASDNFFIIAFICAVLLLVSFKIRTMYKSKAAWLFLAFPVMGMVLTYASSIPRNTAIDEIAAIGGPVTVEGVVHDVTLTSTGIQRLTIFTERIISGGETHYERLKIRATNRADAEELIITPGSRLIFTGTLHQLQPARNPGGFNELYHLGARGYDYTMRLRYQREIGRGTTPLSVLREFRDSITATYYEWLPYDKAGMVETMHREGAVIDTRYNEDCIELDVVIGPGLYGKVKEYIGD